MNIAYYFKNLEPTDALKEYTAEKLEKVRERLHHIQGIDARFSIERQNQIFEVTIHADSHVFHLKKQDKDMYAAIDLTINALNNQIDKYHKKLDERQSTAIDPRDMVPEFQAKPEEEETIVQIYDASPKPMDDVEALLQMKAGNLKFLMFRHNNDKRSSLIMKRPDGNYSIIKPRQEAGQYEEHVTRIKGNITTEISVSLYPMSQLTVTEAIEKLREENLEFIAFVNEESRRMNVMFHAKNGELAIKRPAV